MSTMYPSDEDLAREQSPRSLGSTKKPRKPAADIFRDAVAIYDYIDERGIRLYQVARDHEKNFAQRRPRPARDPSEPEWIHETMDVRRVLYRLPEVVVAVAHGHRVYITEGEKDADNLAKMGLTATTAAMGARAPWLPEYTKQLSGCVDVVVIPDNDKVGREHAEAVASSLVGRAPSLRVLALPVTNAGGDVSDWIASGGSRDQLEALANEAPLYSSPAERFTSIAIGAADFVGRVYEKPRSLLGDGILSAGDLGFLYGRPALGKTWAALMLAIAAVRGGGSWFGIALPKEGLRVGILELELHAFRLQERLKVVAGEDGLTARDNALEIVARPDLRGAVDVLDDRQWSAWGKWCHDSGLDLLIVDSLSRSHHVDENHAADFAPVLARFDELRHDTGTAILPLHHEPKGPSGGKGQQDDMDALRGTSRMASDANVLIRLVKVGQGGEMLSLRFPKVNNAATPAPIHLLRSPSGLLVVTEAPGSVKDKNTAKVQDALREAGRNGLTVEGLKEETRLSKSTIHDHLNALGAVSNGAKKHPRYRLPSESSESASPDSGSLFDGNEFEATGSVVSESEGNSPSDCPTVRPKGRDSRSDSQPVSERPDEPPEQPPSSGVSPS